MIASRVMKGAGERCADVSAIAETAVTRRMSTSHIIQNIDRKHSIDDLVGKVTEYVAWPL